MRGQPAHRKRLTADHAFRPDDVECCTVCGLPETNRHHWPMETKPDEPQERQLRLDIDG